MNPNANWDFFLVDITAAKDTSAYHDPTALNGSTGISDFGSLTVIITVWVLIPTCSAGRFSSCWSALFLRSINFEFVRLMIDFYWQSICENVAVRTLALMPQVHDSVSRMPYHYKHLSIWDQYFLDISSDLKKKASSIFFFILYFLDHYAAPTSKWRIGRAFLRNISVSKFFFELCWLITSCVPRSLYSSSSFPTLWLLLLGSASQGVYQLFPSSLSALASKQRLRLSNTPIFVTRSSKVYWVKIDDRMKEKFAFIKLEISTSYLLYAVDINLMKGIPTTLASFSGFGYSLRSGHVWLR